MKLEFLDRCLKNTQKSNFTKIHPVGAELYHADRRTDTTKLTAAFHNIANAPSNEVSIGYHLCRTNLKKIFQTGWQPQPQLCTQQCWPLS